MWILIMNVFKYPMLTSMCPHVRLKGLVPRKHSTAHLTPYSALNHRIPSHDQRVYLIRPRSAPLHRPQRRRHVPSTSMVGCVRGRVKNTRILRAGECQSTRCRVGWRTTEVEAARSHLATPGIELVRRTVWHYVGVSEHHRFTNGGQKQRFNGHDLK